MCYTVFMRKNILYQTIWQQASGLLDARFGRLSNTANLAALLYQNLPDINWAGFYFLDGHVLRLGPFQGKPACMEIPLGKGVCGNAAQQKRAYIVPDVHAFAGHIACDTSSRSEIVIPLIQHEVLWGVLDIDSPLLNRFDAQDEQFLQKIVSLL